MPGIEVRIGDGRFQGEKIHFLRGRDAIVGRGKACDLRLDLDLVSREHLKFSLTREGVWIVEDLGSTNGTLVNEGPVTRAEIRVGDRVRLGAGGPTLDILTLDPDPRHVVGADATRYVRLSSEDAKRLSSLRQNTVQEQRPHHATPPSTSDRPPGHPAETIHVPRRGRIHPVIRVLLLATGLAFGTATGLAVWGNGFPYVDLAAPALWLGLHFGEGIPANMLAYAVPSFLGLYFAFVGFLLLKRWLGLVALSALIVLHFMAMNSLLDYHETWDAIVSMEEAPFVVAILAGAPKEPAPTDPAEEKPPDTDIVNSLGMRLVRLPAASFDLLEPSGRWQKRVTLRYPQHVSVCEVTVSNFRAFADASGYRTTREEAGEEYTWRNPSFPQAENHPVVLVTIEDAQAFCKWISSVEERSYRLPASVEWEYACRAGGATPFSFGEDSSELARYGNYCDRSCTLEGYVDRDDEHEDGYSMTARVGSFIANPWRLSDLHGNVAEWCCCRDSDGVTGVLRGGGFTGSAMDCRSGLESQVEAGAAHADVGFRIVLFEEAREMALREINQTLRDMGACMEKGDFQRFYDDYLGGVIAARIETNGETEKFFAALDEGGSEKLARTFKRMIEESPVFGETGAVVTWSFEMDGKEAKNVMEYRRGHWRLIW